MIAQVHTFLQFLLFVWGQTFFPFPGNPPAAASSPTVSHFCQNNTFGTTITCAFGTTPTGNELILTMNFIGTGTFAAPTGTNCGTWSTQAFTGASSGTQAVYKSTGAGGGSCTVSEVMASGSATNIFMAVRDISNYTAFDGTVLPTFSSDASFCTNPCTTPTITPTAANSLVLYDYYSPTNNTVTAPGTFVLDSGTPQALYNTSIMHYLKVVAGAINSTFVTSSAITYYQGILAIH